MICTECSKGKVVLHAFSTGPCIVCGEEICTGHIPCNKVCEQCSEEKGLCEECGKEINPLEQFKDENTITPTS